MLRALILTILRPQYKFLKKVQVGTHDLSNSSDEAIVTHEKMFPLKGGKPTNQITINEATI